MFEAIPLSGRRWRSSPLSTEECARRFATLEGAPGPRRGPLRARHDGERFVLWRDDSSTRFAQRADGYALAGRILPDAAGATIELRHAVRPWVVLVVVGASLAITVLVVGAAGGLQPRVAPGQRIAGFPLLALAAALAVFPIGYGIAVAQAWRRDELARILGNSLDLEKARS